jgi:hypothetical protein
MGARANARTKRPATSSAPATSAYTGVSRGIAGRGIGVEHGAGSGWGWFWRDVAHGAIGHAIDLI